MTLCLIEILLLHCFRTFVVKLFRYRKLILVFSGSALISMNRELDWESDFKSSTLGPIAVIFIADIGDFQAVTSMLVTDVGEEICWWQLWDVGDNFGHFGRQHPLSFYISVGHQHPKDVINIEILSPTSLNSHQHHDVANITVTGYIFPWRFE